MVSIEWRRELPDAEAPTDGAFNEDIPYGLRVSDDCKRLEVETDGAPGADADDGTAGAGFRLFQHCERPERKGFVSAMGAVEQVCRVQHDSAAD